MGEEGADEESLHVPWIMRLPGTFEGGITNDTLTAPVDIFPTLCSLCDVPIPRTVEGFSLRDAWLDHEGAFQQDAILTMGFSAEVDYIKNGADWRGVRTKRYSYARWLSGKTILYDLERDPLQMNNLAGQPEFAPLQDEMESTLQALLKKRNDPFVSAENYCSWFDYQRRVIRNVHGPLGDPEDEPDWSLLS